MVAKDVAPLLGAKDVLSSNHSDTHRQTDGHTKNYMTLIQKLLPIVTIAVASRENVDALENRENQFAI